MKKVLKIIGLGILALILGAVVYIYFSIPKLPDGSELLIDNILESDLPEFVQGQTGYIENDGTKIWYESILPSETAKGTILLFMGISNDALGWPKSFLDHLVVSGFQVIRYDYRGTGFSDWVENWDEKPYSLFDLAMDGKIILDSLKIEKANLLGVSMGGMVAQEFAINFPGRTNTMVLLMSSGNIMDSELPPISKEIVFKLVKTSMRYGVFTTDKNTIKLHLSSRVILKGDADYAIDVEETAKQVLYNIRMRRGYNPNVSKQHQEATFRSGSRYEELVRLEMPVLIMHGINDPFIPVEHSKKMATLIPGAKTKWFVNMGHDIPPILTESIGEEIIKHISIKD